MPVNPLALGASDVKQVISLTYWNNLLTAVNTLATHPPAHCTALSPLPLVHTHPPRHIFKKADINAVRAKLNAMCPHTFIEPLTVPIKKKLIKELLDNMHWCGCDKCLENGTEVIVLVPSPVACCDPQCGPPQTPEFITESSAIHGLQVAPSGWYGRFWYLYAHFDDADHFVSSGNIGCNGRIIAPPYPGEPKILLNKRCNSVTVYNPTTHQCVFSPIVLTDFHYFVRIDCQTSLVTPCTP